MVWKLENHEGIKYWYEGELIERIRIECNAQVHYMNSKFAKHILDLIQEYESKL